MLRDDDLGAALFEISYDAIAIDGLSADHRKRGLGEVARRLRYLRKPRGPSLRDQKGTNIVSVK
jgi:hypothetical protein